MIFCNNLGTRGPPLCRCEGGNLNICTNMGDLESEEMTEAEDQHYMRIGQRFLKELQERVLKSQQSLKTTVSFLKISFHTFYLCLFLFFFNNNHYLRLFQTTPNKDKEVKQENLSGLQNAKSEVRKEIAGCLECPVCLKIHEYYKM